MSIEDLDLILKKDPIITTWEAQSLMDNPGDVERNYVIHAKTHLSLGDTSKYVETIFKWVSENQGTFVGAVLGDYGEGKTSFLVHVWDQSSTRNILTVPPFEWSSFDQILSAISGWVQYKLKPMHPELELKVKRSFEAYRSKTIEDIAKKEAAEMGGDYKNILDLYNRAIENGTFKLASVQATTILDFVKDISEIVKSADYKGVLVLLDEPEVAAKALGNDTVQLFLFNLANALNTRQGNYGFFLSMPAPFYAIASTKFAALPARLQYRGCFPRLGDIYSHNFAETLWKRYADEFKLGEISNQIVTDLTLSAIGQACSSERKDLSYGPRSVVSTFRRMVDSYKSAKTQYQPQDFVDDVLNDEIMVKPEYRTKIQTVLNHPDVNENNEKAIKFFAAFPSGVKTEVLKEIEYDDIVRPLARPEGLIYKTAFAMGLRELRKTTGSDDITTNQLRDNIEAIDNEYLPSLITFNSSLKSFCHEILPFYFKERIGMQLEGWQFTNPMKEMAPGIWMGTVIGAFPQMAKVFPQRAATIIVSAIDTSIKNILSPKLDITSGPVKYDFLFHFALNWHENQSANIIPVSITTTENDIQMKVVINLYDSNIQQDHLAEIVGADRLTPIWILNLMQKMQSVNLNREFEIEWNTLKDLLKQQLITEFNNPDFSSSLIKATLEQTGENISGTGLELLDKACTILLKNHYPEYHTLIKRPQWQTKTDTIINALNNGLITLACKRGRQTWKAPDKDAVTVLNTSRMNLTAGAFSGFEDLIEIMVGNQKGELDIKFKIHPLEQDIRDLISQSEITIKKDHIQCKYLPSTDILQYILKKGYTIEELNKVITIGKARSSFEETKQGAENGLFTRPLDIEELKSQLRSKLEALILELTEFRKIPDAYNPFDPDELEDQIEKIQDEVDFDSVRTAVNMGFTTLHALVQNNFHSLQESYQQKRNGIETFAKQLIESREVAQLKLPDAKSPWRDSMQRYVILSLTKEIDEFKMEFKNLMVEINNCCTSYSFSMNRSPLENLKILNDGWGYIAEFEHRKGQLSQETKRIFRQLTDFSQWVQLLRKSDQVYESIIALGTNPNHRNKYQELLAKFDEIDSSISDHLATLNVNGLSVYPQYSRQIEELENDANNYLVKLKATFDQYKDRINLLLERLGVGERVKLSYNPLETVNQYESLRFEGINLIRRFIIDQVKKESETHNRELAYARDILTSISPEEAAPFSESLAKCTEEIYELEQLINDQWFDKLISSEEEIEFKALDIKIKNLFAEIRGVRQKIQEVTTPSKTIINPEIKKIFEDVPDQGQIDFKELILLTMVKLNDPNQALSHSLEALTELFKQNLIQIKVEKRQR